MHSVQTAQGTTFASANFALTGSRSYLAGYAVVLLTGQADALSPASAPGAHHAETSSAITSPHDDHAELRAGVQKAEAEMSRRRDGSPVRAGRGGVERPCRQGSGRCDVRSSRTLACRSNRRCRSCRPGHRRNAAVGIACGAHARCAGHRPASRSAAYFAAAFRPAPLRSRSPDNPDPRHKARSGRRVCGVKAA